MKDIVILAHFCRDFSETDNGRFLYLAKTLSKDNHVEIITSDFSHGQKQHKESLGHTWPFQITFLHESGYKKNISLKRFSSHHAWGKEVGKYLGKRKKPDIIYAAVPSLTGPAVAAKYCEKNGIRFVIDIQDLWPEAFRMVLNIPIVSKILFMPFELQANGIYKRADEIIAVSQTYVARALKVNYKCSSGHVVYLGTELETYDLGVEDLPYIIKPANEIWVGYCGSLSDSYDIPTLIKAIQKVHKKVSQHVKLIVMGDGYLRKQFMTLACEAAIDCCFTGRLAYNQMCATLNQCDIVVNPIKHGSAASIINKHGDYASSGLPVVNSQESREYRSLVDTYKMGLNCNNEDADDMAEKIKTLICNKSLRLEMGKNARRCAEVKFDRKNSYSEIIHCVLN